MLLLCELNLIALISAGREISINLASSCVRILLVKLFPLVLQPESEWIQRILRIIWHILFLHTHGIH